MIVRLYVLTVAVCFLALAGCQNDAFVNASVDTMRAEYLALENDYFALEDEYFAKVDELEACRNGKESKKDATSSESGQTNGGSSGDSDNGDFSPPRIDFGTPGSPEIDFGTPVDPSELVPNESGSARGSPNDGANADQPGDLQIDLPVEEISYVEPTDKHVTHVIINPYLTTGHDFDSKPGDDGIALLVEPRNGDDQLVPVAGNISIVVLDPALEGSAARVARWDFTAEEAARRIKTGDDRQRGISFKLPWPGTPPEHSKLHVFVRMETDDGKILESETEFYVILPGQFSQRWTPTSQPRSNQSLVGPSAPNRYAVLPAQHTADSRAAETVLAAHAKPIVKEKVLVGNVNASPRNDETLSSSRPKRPVWKPYR